MDMNQPIFPAPSGYVVDLDNPQRTGEAANFWVGTLGMIVAAIFMATRVYTKTRLAKNFTPDDGKLSQAPLRTLQGCYYDFQHLTRSTVALLIAWVRRITTWKQQRAGQIVLMINPAVFLHRNTSPHPMYVQRPSPLPCLL
jgi:hypothetical protein